MADKLTELALEAGKEKAQKGAQKSMGKKSGKPTSRRYNLLPLLASAPGGVRRELTVPICHYKGTTISIHRKK